MNLVILDTETTGLYPSKDLTIEVAAILYNVEHGQMLQCFSTLLPCVENPVEHINHISPAWTLEKYDAYPLLSALEIMTARSDAIIAHNASFDRGFIHAIEAFDSESPLYSTPWICTKTDLKWPSNPSRLRLQDICESYGILYAHAHRALSDCNLLMNCLQKVDNLQPRIEEILQRKN